MKRTRMRKRGSIHGQNPSKPDGGDGRLLRPSPAELQQYFSRNTWNLYHSNQHLTYISNIIFNHPKSSWIARIEQKHFHHQNFKFIIQTHFSTKFKTNHISMFQATGSTQRAKRDGRFPTYLKCSALNSCPQVSTSSRSTLLSLPWSFEQKESTENT